MDSVKIKEIHDLVHNASIVVAHYWPMTTFVHHNPIRSLEKYPFHEAVQVARHFIGGRGYLSNEMYRKLVKSGRITSKHIDAAIQSFAQNKNVKIGEEVVSHSDVLRAHLLEGITAPSEETITAFINRSSGGDLVRLLSERLSLKSNDKTNKLARDISLASWCDHFINTQVVWQINRELIKWCEAFLDEGHASWSMPEREKGFYGAWKLLASQEWSPCGISGCNKKINALPESPEEALLEHLDMLKIPEEMRQDYLSLQLTSLYGWASFINWRSEQNDYNWQVAYPIDLVQYLAVRLFYERELVDQTCRAELDIEGNFNSIQSYIQNKIERVPSGSENTNLAAAWRLTKLAEALEISHKTLEVASADQLQQLLNWLDDFPESEHGPVWLDAYESGYQHELIDKFKETIVNFSAVKRTRPLAQLMFCIDVRSEPFRRNLEVVGNYETLGFAGFFGIPISCQALDQHHETAQCPAILQPKYRVHEVVRDGQGEKQVTHDSRKNLMHMFHEILHDLKNHVLTPYNMVEALGWFFGWHLIEKTFFPGVYRKWQERFHRAVVPPVATKITVDKDSSGLGMTSDEHNASIEMALRTMGLTDNFARLVIVVGHTSLSDNNPYEAALNCGACGGNSGEPNARLFAAIANKPEVREHLAKNGIVLPEDTHFIGAVHNTTTDALDLYDIEDIPETHKEDVEKLKKDLHKAALQNNLERCIKLPGARNDLSLTKAAEEVCRRSGDWSETRPEWGLSGNASFIIGRRALTRDLNLEGRAFLNSHDYRLDPTGALLEGILMGPMVVGQWINAEHYFSATDPEIYGSGSKIYHNVVGRIGIMSGPQSDLRTGLSLQSVASGDLTYHEPLRLFVAIEAPRQRILDIIDRQPALKQLCDNEWIHVLAIDHESDKKLSLYRAKQGWIDIDGSSLSGVFERKIMNGTST